MAMTNQVRAVAIQIPQTPSTGIAVNALGKIELPTTLITPPINANLA